MFFKEMRVLNIILANKQEREKGETGKITICNYKLHVFDYHCSHKFIRQIMPRARASSNTFSNAGKIVLFHFCLGFAMPKIEKDSITNKFKSQMSCCIDPQNLASGILNHHILYKTY